MVGLNIVVLGVVSIMVFDFVVKMIIMLVVVVVMGMGSVIMVCVVFIVIVFILSNVLIGVSSFVGFVVGYILFWMGSMGGFNGVVG